MMNAVQAGALLVIRRQDVPRSPFGIGRIEHRVTSARIREPLAARRKIHRAELPLTKGIIHARFESALLLLITYFQPNFDKCDAAAHDIFFKLGTELQEGLVLVLGTEAHHMFNPGMIAPTAI